MSAPPPLLLWFLGPFITPRYVVGHEGLAMSLSHFQWHFHVACGHQLRPTFPLSARFPSFLGRCIRPPALLHRCHARFGALCCDGRGILRLRLCQQGCRWTRCRPLRLARLLPPMASPFAADLVSTATLAALAILRLRHTFAGPALHFAGLLLGRRQTKRTHTAVAVAAAAPLLVCCWCVTPSACTAQDAYCLQSPLTANLYPQVTSHPRGETPAMPARCAEKKMKMKMPLYFPARRANHGFRISESERGGVEGPRPRTRRAGGTETERRKHASCKRREGERESSSEGPERGGGGRGREKEKEEKERRIHRTIDRLFAIGMGKIKIGGEMFLASAKK